MNRYRYRLTFAKGGDLRWISHRDLLRTLERALRRAGLRLAMSQGFHPKPRLSFPSRSRWESSRTAEVMELELSEPTAAADEVRQRLQSQLPAGLSLRSAEGLTRRTGSSPRTGSATGSNVPTGLPAGLAGGVPTPVGASPLPCPQGGTRSTRRCPPRVDRAAVGWCASLGRTITSESRSRGTARHPRGTGPDTTWKQRAVLLRGSRWSRQHDRGLSPTIHICDGAHFSP